MNISQNTYHFDTISPRPPTFKYDTSMLPSNRFYAIMLFIFCRYSRLFQKAVDEYVASTQMTAPIVEYLDALENLQEHLIKVLKFQQQRKYAVQAAQETPCRCFEADKRKKDVLALVQQASYTNILYAGYIRDYLCIYESAGASSVHTDLCFSDNRIGVARYLNIKKNLTWMLILVLCYYFVLMAAKPKIFYVIWLQQLACFDL